MMTTSSETKRGLTALVVWAAMLLSVVVLMLASGCSKESDYLHDAEAQPLTFSSDTVMFDTVFVAMGTTTHHFMVYNRGSKPVKIASVTMQQGAASRFRLNVDGDSSRVVRNVTLAAGDSLFVFIQALIDPTDEASPFLVTDAVVFDVEGCATQQLLVTAYGRNAVYHLPTDTLMKGTLDRYGNPYAYSIIDCDNWDHTLPHVIVGYAVVYDDTLHLKAGDELYFANDAVLWVFNEASLRVSGNEEHPVLFTSVRHDGWYGTLPGQWGHIWLGGISGGTCRPCVISHAVIENAYYGIVADSNATGNDVVFTDGTTTYAYDPADGSFSTTQTIFASNSDTSGGQGEAYHAPRFRRYQEYAATPADPNVSYFQDMGRFSILMLNVPLQDTEGRFMDPSKVSYQLYIDDDDPYTLYTDEYTRLPEDIDEVPYLFTDENREAFSRSYICEKAYAIYLFQKGFDRIGVQTIYRGGGEEHMSNICYWNFNEPDHVDGIANVQDAKPVASYDMTGRQVEQVRKGFSITRMSDGRVVKTIRR